MSLTKRLFLIPTVSTLLALSGCGAGEELTKDGDPPEVTCQRLHGVLEQFSDVDPAAMGFGEILALVSDGFAEMETIADEAQDEELAQSIDTMTETLNASIASAGGDLDAVGAEFSERVQQQPEAQQAAAHLDEVCGLDMPF